MVGPNSPSSAADSARILIVGRLTPAERARLLVRRGFRRRMQPTQSHISSTLCALACFGELFLVRSSLHAIPLRPFVISAISFVKICLRELSVDSLKRRESAPSRSPLASSLRN